MYKYTFDLEFKIHKWMNSMLVPYDWDQDVQFTESDIDEDLDDERDDMIDVFGVSEVGGLLKDRFELDKDEDGDVVGGTIKGVDYSDIHPDEVERELETMERLCNTYLKGDWDCSDTEILFDISIHLSPIPKDESFNSIENGDEFLNEEGIDWMDDLYKVIESVSPDFDSMTNYVADLDDDSIWIKITSVEEHFLGDGVDNKIEEKVKDFLEKRFPNVEVGIGISSYDHNL